MMLVAADDMQHVLLIILDIFLTFYLFVSMGFICYVFVF